MYKKSDFVMINISLFTLCKTLHKQWFRHQDQFKADYSKGLRSRSFIQILWRGGSDVGKCLIFMSVRQ